MEYSPVAERIAAARMRAGLTERTVAERLGLTLAGYRDLESYDAEVFRCISLGQLCSIGAALGVSPRALVSADGRPRVKRDISAPQLIQRIREQMTEDALTAGTFGERAGWDVTSALSGPERLWMDWCLEGLRDVCRVLGVDWRAVLPGGSDD